MKRLLFLSFLFCFLFLGLSAQEYHGLSAERIVPGAQSVWLKPHLQLPAFIRFAPNQEIPRQQFEGFVKETLSWQMGEDDWQLLSSDIDMLGHLHERYQQTYQGLPVEGSMIIVHSKNDMVYAVNGDFFAMKQDLPMGASLSKADALQAALTAVGARTYKWELPGEEAMLQELAQGDPNRYGPHTYYPEGELVYAAKDAQVRQNAWHLTWKFDVYADAPLSRQYVFVDAHSGEVVLNLDRLHTSDVQGTAVTRYSATQTITTDSTGPGAYRLQEAGRGNGIRTWNMQTGTNYNSAVDFTDTDNIWNNVNAAQDEVAGDAHWGAEMTYDYFFLKHGRNSIDGNGFQLNSYVHYDVNFANAFWDGQRMTYGDGNSPLTTLDISGHEISHGLTNFTADLIYQNQSGALNESFSDIFGKTVENFARPNRFSWRIGGDLGNGIRDMANPNLFNDPKNYLGNDWFTGAGDNGGVHINSGVQNHWFYLLVTGGTGTNDFGNVYTINGLGLDTASSVAFRNLTVYLTPTSQYEDARFFAVQSAIDIYGPCGRVHEAVENAWYAVGVAQQPFDTVATSDFFASATELCSQPYEINFTEASSLSSSYHWNFGDGDTSNLANPVHTYSTPGTYSVSLEINGICGGLSSSTKTNYITLQPSPGMPSLVVADTNVSCGGQTLLVATGTDEVNWYNGNGELLAIGDTFAASNLKSSVTYYARNIETSAPQKVGPADGIFVGSGGYHNSGFESRLEFTVYKSMRLKSVFVDANSSGTRTIVLEDANGNVVETRSVSIPAGRNRVTLDWDINPGQYQIGGSNMDLYRNNGGANYPYELQGVVSITGSNANTSNNFYYYFYDWEVITFCKSDELPVTVNVNNLDAPQVGDVNLCESGPAVLSLSNPRGSVNWYDNSGNLVGNGPTYTTSVISTPETYYVEEEVVSPVQIVGPFNGNAVGGGGYHDSGFDARLFFEVFQSVRLVSVWVDANSTGVRNIVLEDDNGNFLQNVNVNIQAGQSRVNLNLDLQPGKYAIGGSNMDLYRNNGGANYPYEIPGLVSITGSNANTNGTFYYYFYDWRVQEPSCVSDQTPILVSVSGAPTADFSFSQAAGLYSFQDNSTHSNTWSWDFGDGSSSTVQSPAHGYATTGTYTVTLIVSNQGCTDTTTQEVKVDIANSLEDDLLGNGMIVYPNPGAGSFWVEASTSGIKEMQVRVYNSLGQTVFMGSPTRTASLQEEVSLEGMPPGTYLVQLQVEGKMILKKYLLTR